MRLSFVIALLFAAACSKAATTGRGGATSITANDLRVRIGILADDSMRGRDTPSPELNEVAEYIAGEFARVGLEPAGDDGTFIQHYPIERVRLDTAVSHVRLAGHTLRFGTDAVRARGGWTGDTPATGNVTVLRQTPPDGTDLSGRVAVVVPALGDDGMPDQDGFRMIRAVGLMGPAAVITVVDPTPDTWAESVTAQGRTTLSIPWQQGGGRAPSVYVRKSALPPLGALTGTRAEVAVVSQVVERVTAPNVVGILRGSDTTLASQYVVFSGHMDHVGVGRPVNGDSIYNGADDDASGTSTVLELAEAFAGAAQRPARSLIFLTVSGEEKGLWGSAYFTSHPTVPMDHIVADLNSDMVGRNWQDTIVAIGKEHSDLGATLNAVNAEHPELDMHAIDDRWPEERFYFRSDHYNFARRGVPILFFFNGVHEDYHRPSDEPDKIEYDKAARIGRLIYYLGERVANSPQPPQWNPESRAEIVQN